jgi:MFS family permease
VPPGPTTALARTAPGGTFSLEAPSYDGEVEGPGRIARLRHIVRSSLADLVDQSRPFGRLALVHILITAGSTFVTISLAGSLFFSISLHAAKGRVLLYLLLTMTPFVVVAPLLSPLLDRGRQARRASIVFAAGGSAACCALMSGALRSLLLFPEAFAVLVLSKLYLVAKSSLLPALTEADDDLASANAKLTVLASLTGIVAAPLGVGVLELIDARAVLYVGVVVFSCAVLAATRLPRLAVEDRDRPSAVPVGPLLVGRHRGKRSWRGHALPPASPEVVLGVTAMAVIRGTVGFLEFFLAFELRRLHAATWWYGLMLVGSGAGGLLGALMVPRLRRHTSEQGIILAALAAVFLTAVGAALSGSLWAEPLLTLVVGAASTTAKPSFDSLAQRYVPPDLLGRSFAGFETRLQLVWVISGLVAVLVAFALRPGDIVIAIGCSIAAVFYASMRRSLRAHLGPEPLADPRSPGAGTAPTRLG